MDDFESGLCQCAAFDSPEGEADRSPLLSQSPGVKVPCNEEGAASCKKLCLALARAAGARGPEVLCDAVSHLDSVKVKLCFNYIYLLKLSHWYKIYLWYTFLVHKVYYILVYIST